jgi:hypothetical protein
MDFIVAICSHNRAEAIKQKTLKMLDGFFFPHRRIYIFCSANEMSAYKEALREEFAGVNLVIGALGLSAQRRAVSEYFEEGQNILCLDDDVEKLMRLDGNETFENLIGRGFSSCLKNGAHLWGFYPCANKLWLKPSVTVGLSFIYGCSYGLINCKDVQTTLALKEDYERSMKFFRRDGVVVRLNDVAPCQKYKKNAGGLSDIRTKAAEEAECTRLISEFPDLCKIVYKKEWPELRLKRLVNQTK